MVRAVVKATETSLIHQEKEEEERGRRNRSRSRPPLNSLLRQQQQPQKDELS